MMQAVVITSGSDRDRVLKLYSEDGFLGLISGIRGLERTRTESSFDGTWLYKVRMADGSVHIYLWLRPEEIRERWS